MADSIFKQMGSVVKTAIDALAATISNVDNTSDLDKPISTATQTALDGKVNDSQVLTDVPAGAVFTDTVYSHPSTHSISEVSGLQAALDEKSNTVDIVSNVGLFEKGLF